MENNKNFTKAKSLNNKDTGFYILIIFLFFIILIVAATIISLAFIYPKVTYIDQSFLGIKFSQGVDQEDFATPVRIQLKGELRVSFNGDKKYVGKFKVFEEGIYDPRIDAMNKSDAIIAFRREGGTTWGNIDYWNPSDYASIHYGILFIDAEFSKISILVYGNDEQSFISAPATTLNEAIEIKKAVMDMKLYPNIN